ncbi:MAG: hypothetical protein V1837_08285 [Candidatus Woesearchaeota archaeon]
MLKPKKPNTPEEVMRRIAKFNESLETLIELTANSTELGGFSFKPESAKGLQQYMVAFLQDKGVRIGIQGLLEENTRPSLDLAECSYRLANKIVKLNWEKNHPVLSLQQTFDVLKPCYGIPTLINLRNKISDCYSVNPAEVIFLAENIFPKLSHGLLFSPELKQNPQLQEVYAIKVQEYFNNLYALLEEYSTNQTSKILDKIRKLHEAGFPVKLDENHKAELKINIPIKEIQHMAASKTPVDDFEIAFGHVMGIKYSRNIHKLERSVTVFTQRDSLRDSLIRYIIDFPNATEPLVSAFFQKLADKATTGGSSDLKQMNIKTQQQLREGYLMDRKTF